jgi:hypothetical protein
MPARDPEGVLGENLHYGLNVLLVGSSLSISQVMPAAAVYASQVLKPRGLRASFYPIRLSIVL